jgi:hypothetical protein
LKQILHNNKYNTTVLNKITNKKQEQDNQNTKWAKFTYIRKETRFITKLFKNTILKIAHTTNNNLRKPLSTQQTQKQNKYDKSSVYQLICPTRNKKYIRQTGASVGE